jgi:dextranase
MKDLNTQTVRILDMYPTKAQFRSGDGVTLTIELVNESDHRHTVSVSCSIFELDTEVGTPSLQYIDVPPHDSVIVQLEAGSFKTEFTGYGVEVSLIVDGEVVDQSATAFDVVSDWRKAPRYGFLSDFGSEQCGDDEDVKWLTKLHLNLVQFYDWMYRHDDLVAEDNITYVDLMGREVNRSVVEEKIQLCHDHGMIAIAYGAVYAASKEFAEQHPDWRLYTSAGDPYDFIGIFNIMNISSDCPWHFHIVNQYKRAVEKMDFDGIHMDTYGFPKTGWSRLDGIERLEQLAVQFPQLIERTRMELSQVKDDVGLIFNNVGNWPVDTVARTSQDAIYVEVWKPYERYFHLADIIRWARHCSDGKPVILAAYLKPFREPGPLGLEGAEHAFRLLNAVVTANRAYHLLHGEAGGVLTQGYYVDHSQLRPDFMRTVRDYADFGVRFSHIIYDQRLRDVTMTHTDGDNMEYQFAGFPCSTYGEAGRVWTIMGECESMKVIHFVNLLSAADDLWNESKNAFEPVEGRLVSVAFDGEVESILLASPDVQGGKAIPLDYRIEVTSRGKVIVLELPPLLYWDMVMIKVKCD